MIITILMKGSLHSIYEKNWKRRFEFMFMKTTLIVTTEILLCYNIYKVHFGIYN